MPYINFSDDDLYRANTADLVSYLERRGERVKRVGSTYKYIYTDGSGTQDRMAHQFRRSFPVFLFRIR